MWGATSFSTHMIYHGSNFNPRAPCGARQDYVTRKEFDELISIHAPRVGRDLSTGCATTPSRNFNPRAPCGARPPVTFTGEANAQFQSTRPVWGATRPAVRPAQRSPISIHAPRVGRDAAWMVLIPHGQNFNPRAPCGARRGHGRETVRRVIFQSTRPVWGATRLQC